jgi:hypothetical protein
VFSDPSLVRLEPTTGSASDAGGAAAMPPSDVVSGVVLDGGVSLSVTRNRGKAAGDALLVGVAVTGLSDVVAVFVVLGSVWLRAVVPSEDASVKVGGVAVTVESGLCAGPVLSSSDSSAVVLAVRKRRWSHSH